MIRSWRYENGHWDIEFRERPSWRCQLYIKKSFELENWFSDQGAKLLDDYDADFRFNSGDPCYYISIYDEKLATAFLLRWKDDEN
jgi:hypothetical protein